MSLATTSGTEEKCLLCCESFVRITFSYSNLHDMTELIGFVD